MGGPVNDKAMTPLAPGAMIGIVGGGQLGRLLALAAGQLGFDVCILCPEENCPASRVAAHTIVAAYDDVDALTALAGICDIVTYEFENVPARTVELIEQAGAQVRPSAKALEMSQDRLTEKDFLNGIGIPTVDYRPIDDAAALDAALAEFGGAGLLKTRREGYDGKGQVRLGRSEDAKADALALIEGGPCLLEAFAPFEREISVIVVRGAEVGGTIGVQTYDAAENQHANGILVRSTVPAEVSGEIRDAANRAGKQLAASLDYIGVLGLEFFVMKDGALLANEFAPRVHNSGHWTPEACMTGQFEQHIRAVAGWPLGPVDRIFDVEMDNILGQDITKIPTGFDPDTRLVPYGKTEPRAGRKMAHITKRVRRT